MFVCESESGGRLIYHYPRLHAAITAEESAAEFAKPWTAWSLKSRFRAIPTVDANDGEEVLCYRSWLPSPVANVY